MEDTKVNVLRLIKARHQEEAGEDSEEMPGPGGRGRPTRASNKRDLGTTPGEAASSTGLRSGRPRGPGLTTSRDPHLLVSGVGSLSRRGLRSPTLGEVGNWLQAPCSSPPTSLRTPAETAAAPHPQTGLDPGGLTGQ